MFRTEQRHFAVENKNVIGHIKYKTAAEKTVIVITEKRKLLQSDLENFYRVIFVTLCLWAE